MLPAERPRASAFFCVAHIEGLLTPDSGPPECFTTRVSCEISVSGAVYFH